MRSEPKPNLAVVLKHQEKDASAQVMYIDKVLDKENVSLKWITKDGVPYKVEMNTQCLERYNPKRVE